MSGPIKRYVFKHNHRNTNYYLLLIGITTPPLQYTTHIHIYNNTMTHKQPFLLTMSSCLMTGLGDNKLAVFD